MVDNGYYFVGAFSNRNLVLDVVNHSIRNGANVTLWDKAFSTNQVWEFKQVHGAYYQIVNINSWNALSAVGGGAGNGVNVVQRPQNNRDPLQLWRVDMASNGSVHLVNQGSGKYLDIQGGYAHEGTNIWTWEATDNNRGRGQQFSLEKTGSRNRALNYDGEWIYFNGGGWIDRQAGINRLMSIANSLLGVPYVWLGVYPQDGGMDCASFTWYVYRQLGVSIGFETYYSVNDGFDVSLADAQPGDLIFMYYSYRGPEHVVLYAGNGMIYEEPDFGMSCQYVLLWSKGAGYVRVKRILS